MTATQQPAGSPSLARNAIGLPEVLFQSITHMAPAVATVLSIGAATGFAGRLTPLAVLIAMVAVLFTAYSIGQLAKHLPSAGGMYTYVGRALGPFFGWLIAWAFALAEPLVAPILLAAFGNFSAVFLATYLGIETDFTLTWVAFAVICGLVVWWLLYSGIQISTRTVLVLGVIEIAVFLIVSLLLVINAGSANTVSVFIPGEEGPLPAFQGMIFALLAFVGFEAAAPLGEESREPRRIIPRAVWWSALLVGAFYLFNYYAATVFFGPDEMTGFATANNSDPWGGMAREVLGTLGGLLVIFAILNSCLANASAGATAATRSWFSMGRAGLLPRLFAAVSPSSRAPVNAIHIQMALAIVIAIVGGLVLIDDPYPASGPINIYVFIGTMVTLLFAGMYITVNVSVIAYYLRERRSEFNVAKHIVVPVLGVLFMIPAFIALVGGITIPILNVTPPAFTGALAWTAPIAVAWMVVGIVLYFVLRARNPAALDRVDDVYGGDASSPDA